MEDALIGLLERSGFEGGYAIIILLVARPIGLVFGFQAFAWAIANSVFLRIGIAFAIGLPAIVTTLPAMDVVVTQANPLAFAMVVIRELAVGFVLGLLASLPFFALQYAGSITDNFRGESDGGQIDPSGGGTLQTFSVLYLVIGFSVFFAEGGLWSLVDIMYRSYEAIPFAQNALSFADTAPVLILRLMGDMLSQSIRLALPLLALLVTIEVAIWVAARIARRMGLYDLAFPSKNLAAICALPLVAWFVYLSAGPLTGDALRTFGFFDRIFVGGTL